MLMTAQTNCLCFKTSHTNGSGYKINNNSSLECSTGWAKTRFKWWGQLCLKYILIKKATSLYLSVKMILSMLLIENTAKIISKGTIT